MRKQTAYDDIIFTTGRGAQSVMIRTFDDGESVLLHLETEHYFGLNAVGSRMWELLTTSESIDAAYATLLEEYEVEPDVLRADLETLIGKLADGQLVEVQDAENADFSSS